MIFVSSPVSLFVHSISVKNSRDNPLQPEYFSLDIFDTVFSSILLYFSFRRFFNNFLSSPKIVIEWIISSLSPSYKEENSLFSKSINDLSEDLKSPSIPLMESESNSIPFDVR